MKKATQPFEMMYGTITQIRQAVQGDGTSMQGRRFLHIEDGKGSPVVLDIDDSSLLLDEDIGVGDNIAAVINANAPMILIYPPQYRPLLLAKVTDDKNFKLELFGDDLISADGMLKLHVVSDSAMLNLQGKTVEASALENHWLLVIYTISTRSIPAQTTPQHIVLLDG